MPCGHVLGAPDPERPDWCSTCEALEAIEDPPFPQATPEEAAFLYARGWRCNPVTGRWTTLNSGACTPEIALRSERRRDSAPPPGGGESRYHDRILARVQEEQAAVRRLK